MGEGITGYDAWKTATPPEYADEIVCVSCEGGPGYDAAGNCECCPDCGVPRESRRNGGCDCERDCPDCGYLHCRCDGGREYDKYDAIDRGAW